MYQKASANVTCTKQQPGTSCPFLHSLLADVQGFQHQRYKVSVQTADKRGAGTDADISISILGSKGSSKEMRLESSANNFERGQVCGTVVLGQSSAPCSRPVKVIPC